MRFNKTTRIAAAIAVIGAVAAGGAAFTDTTGQAAGQSLGFGSTTVTGGQVTGISYQLDASGADINTITLTTTADLTTSGYNGGPSSVFLAFDNDGFGTLGGQADATCVVQSSGTTTICSPVNPTTVASVQSVQIAITDGTALGNTFG